MNTLSGQARYSMYSPGTVEYRTAVTKDYESGIIDWNTAQGLLSPYYDPATGAPLKSGWESFWTGLGSAGTNILNVFSQYQKYDYQKQLAEYDIERRKALLATGMVGEGAVPSYGGINVYTLLMLAGVGLLAILLLKSK